MILLKSSAQHVKNYGHLDKIRCKSDLKKRRKLMKLTLVKRISCIHVFVA